MIHKSVEELYKHRKFWGKGLRQRLEFRNQENGRVEKTRRKIEFINRLYPNGVIEFDTHWKMGVVLKANGKEVYLERQLKWKDADLLYWLRRVVR